jgi:uncharacterized membrane protein YebE (DUF533 family)
MDTRADHQIEDVKRSFVEHVQELERRFKDARTRFDPRNHISAHPLAAVGIAFAAGALLGFISGGGSSREPGEKKSVGGMVMGALGALAMSAVRSYAMRQISGAAQDWLARESRETEPMLEH